MITDNLYEKVLIQPVKDGHDELFIVSGYTSATFLRRHLYEIKDINENIKINLIRGMRKIGDHSAFLSLLNENTQSFSGYYYQGTPQVHSKAYCWMKNGQPSVGFSGSANYSQPGFFGNEQQNQMVNDSANEIKDYFLKLLEESVSINEYEHQDDEILSFINVGESVPPGEGLWVQEDVSVRVSILSKKLGNKIANKDSLNWGQREGRERNQGCLNIRGDAKKEGFLPPIGHTFTLLTDDGVTMDCTRQQQGGKAISTTYNNSELGLYFRNRLGVRSGEFVKTEDLINYGRTDFLLKKLDEETFFLDFRSS